MMNLYVKFQLNAFLVTKSWSSKNQRNKSRFQKMVRRQANKILDHMLTLGMEVQLMCPKINICLRILQYPRPSRFLWQGDISSRIRGGKSFSIALPFPVVTQAKCAGKSKGLNLSSSCVAKLISQWKWLFLIADACIVCLSLMNYFYYSTILIWFDWGIVGFIFQDKLFAIPLLPACHIQSRAFQIFS